MKTTSIKASDLNYDRYSLTKYDRDIANAIPFHKEVHARIALLLGQRYKRSAAVRVLDLGVGTGITSAFVRQVLPQCRLDVVDFSKRMLDHCRRKLGGERVRYRLGDYSQLTFKDAYDMVVSVVGVHHQTDAGKRKLFKKIFRLLKPGGVFIFGDLVTYKDEDAAAYNQALHFHHLVQCASDKKALAEWAHHHLFLNDLAPIEAQVRWLKEAGFKVKVEFLKMNTALLVCEKSL